MNMDFKRKLPIPKLIKEMYPLTEKTIKIKQENDEEIKNIFRGKSDKFLLIIGPCSADREEPVLEYVKRLRMLQEQVKDKIFIIPRIYTNKPRTTGDGYKGILHQPNPTEKPDLLKGLIKSRELLIRVLNETSFSAADEMLYPENHRYFSDVLSYVAIGARSVEDQQHRLTASGLNIPVGMKNPTSGDYNVLLNSIHASQNGHMFIYRGWEVESFGNELSHAVLRGFISDDGKNHSNYSFETLKSFYELYTKAGLKNPSVIIDTNHSNSNKDYLKQIDISIDVLNSRNRDQTIKKFVKGLMIESYLEDGNQEVDGTIYGKSITDPCLGWDKTVDLINEIYKRL